MMGRNSHVTEYFFEGPQGLIGVSLLYDDHGRLAKRALFKDGVWSEGDD
jgi:hypothetical protein